jgi:hypothetical protein
VLFIIFGIVMICGVSQRVLRFLVRHGTEADSAFLDSLRVDPLPVTTVDTREERVGKIQERSQTASRVSALCSLRLPFLSPELSSSVLRELPTSFLSLDRVQVLIDPLRPSLRSASETPNPRETVPSAVKNTFWRITIIYITSLTIIGLLIGYNDERLLGASGSAASPFVIVFAYANVKGLDHLVNTTIVISVLSIGLSCVYAGSRTLTALAETGFAPKIFCYIDKSGRP